MSDPVALALIGLVSSTVPFIFGYLNNRKLNRLHDKVDEAKTQVSQVGASVAAVHEEVNGKMARLVEVTGESERAKGKLEGRAEAQAENTDANKPKDKK